MSIETILVQRALDFMEKADRVNPPFPYVKEKYPYLYDYKDADPDFPRLLIPTAKVVKDLIEIDRECWEDQGETAERPWSDTQLAAMLLAAAYPDNADIVNLHACAAELHDRIAGYILWAGGGTTFIEWAPKMRNQLEIVNIAVARDARHQGVGSELLNEALEDARSRRSFATASVTRADIDFINLALSAGFVPVDRRLPKVVPLRPLAESKKTDDVDLIYLSRPKVPCGLPSPSEAIRDVKNESSACGILYLVGGVADLSWLSEKAGAENVQACLAQNLMRLETPGAIGDDSMTRFVRLTRDGIMTYHIDRFGPTFSV